MEENVGEKIKRLRLSMNKRLKDVSADTGLSISFLSQVERGVNAISLYSLERVASALGVNTAYFLDKPAAPDDRLMRSYHRSYAYADGPLIYQRLDRAAPDYQLCPIEVSVLPFDTKRPSQVLPHEGEEFIYVLEGVLTVILGDRSYELNPGDAMHYLSSVPHDWRNYSGRTVRLLSVSTPPIDDGDLGRRPVKS
ncbi:MAG: helix-turn-helix transcriptional regulator [Firmicutes bacterium]|nr:helix-turn-helix transcriptional regulator [Bacillota bacterium]